MVGQASVACAIDGAVTLLAAGKLVSSSHLTLIGDEEEGRPIDAPEVLHGTSERRMILVSLRFDVEKLYRL